MICKQLLWAYNHPVESGVGRYMPVIVYWICTAMHLAGTCVAIDRFDWAVLRVLQTRQEHQLRKIISDNDLRFNRYVAFSFSIVLLQIRVSLTPLTSISTLYCILGLTFILFVLIIVLNYYYWIGLLNSIIYDEKPINCVKSIMSTYQRVKNKIMSFKGRARFRSKIIISNQLLG